MCTVAELEQQKIESDEAAAESKRCLNRVGSHVIKIPDEEVDEEPGVVDCEDEGGSLTPTKDELGEQEWQRSPVAGLMAQHLSMRQPHSPASPPKGRSPMGPRGRPTRVTSPPQHNHPFDREVLAAGEGSSRVGSSVMSPTVLVRPMTTGASRSDTVATPVLVSPISPLFPRHTTLSWRLTKAACEQGKGESPYSLMRRFHIKSEQETLKKSESPAAKQMREALDRRAVESRRHGKLSFKSFSAASGCSLDSGASSSVTVHAVRKRSAGRPVAVLHPETTEEVMRRLTHQLKAQRFEQRQTATRAADVAGAGDTRRRQRAARLLRIVSTTD